MSNSSRDSSRGEKYAIKQEAREEKPGRRLFQALQAGHAIRGQQRAFRSYLNAFAIASDIVDSITKKPGFVDLTPGDLRENMTEMVQAVESARSQMVSSIARQLGVEPGTINDNPAYLAQINRFSAAIVTRYWTPDAEENRQLFETIPGGAQEGKPAAKTVGFQSAVFSVWSGFLARQMDDADIREGEPEYPVNRNLDRVLALHSVFLQVDDSIRPFVYQYGDASVSSRVREAFFGKPAVDKWGGDMDSLADEMAQRVIDEVVLASTDERLDSMLAVFDPERRLGAKDWHIANRALLRNVSRDVGLILDHEQALFQREAKASISNQTVQQYADQGGFLVPWLKARLDTRLDRIYPQPAEYQPRPEQDHLVAKKATPRSPSRQSGSSKSDEAGDSEKRKKSEHPSP